jgi:hypothetical protein
LKDDNLIYKKSEFGFFKGVFNLLKNEGHDMTASVVQCLICKTVYGTG